MKKIRKSWKNTIYILILLIGVIILFQWFFRTTSDRIESQNLSYSWDAACQTAKRIEGEFTSGIQRIHTYSSLLNTASNKPEITPQMLKTWEENSDFDAFRYVDENGFNTASDGKNCNIYDRDYFQRSIKGEIGSTVILESRITGDPMMIFYAPLRYNGEIFGVLLGMYYAEDYLQQMLTTSYFDEPADLFLCNGDGMMIACSDSDIDCSRSLIDVLLEKKIVDIKTAENVQGVLDGTEEEQAFVCGDDCKTDNICVINIPDTDYFLIQTFPASVTQTMINNANRAGIIVQVILICMFAIYISVLVVQSRKERRQLEKENTEMGYITTGTRALFNRFTMADLENNTYKYLMGTSPADKGFAPNGSYSSFVQYLCSNIVEEEDGQNLADCFASDAIADELNDDSLNTQYEYRIKVNGVLKWEHMNIICLERKNGRASKVLFLRQDITKLKEKELNTQSKIAVANRKERQYMTATMSDAICAYEINLTKDIIPKDIVFQEEGQQISMLKQVGLQAPCRASDWFSLWKQFVDEESIEDYCKGANVGTLLESFEQGKREYVIEYWRHTVSGQKICIRQSFFMTWDDETNDIMAMAIIKEITGQVQKQREQVQALHDALMQAQHANKAKTTFLNNMSHDIRTPMNAIIGFTTIAVSHIDNKEQVLDCLKKVLSSSNHLLSLINDILDMSRIESGKVQIKEQECNISELTHNLVNIIQSQVKAKQLELFIDTFNVVNEDVIADSLKLSQVFLNLLSNAVKYTMAGGTVTFRIIQESTFHRGFGDYKFIVKDNGIGMSEEFVKHIFEPFEREYSVTRTGIQGTGLGMAITKNIVEMMGGDIIVKSEKGKGSEFIVRLSLKLQDVEKNTAQIKELEGVRAMVVDDDPTSCDSVAKMLKQVGMRAEWTTSGSEAVYRARMAYNEGDSYHTYIIDWQMPEMSGIETAKKIRSAIGKEVPIIILTAYDWTDIEQEAKEAGITAFCAKPLFMSDLKAVLLSANNLADKKPESDLPWTDIDFKGKRVLLVEDNELNREIAEEILKETGLIVETAPDGTDAVAMMDCCPENYYDAILMDVQMPVMDGYEATRTIRAMHRKDAENIPIIAMTANAMEEDKQMALTSGMNDHIAKPIDAGKFLSVLGKFLYR